MAERCDPPVYQGPMCCGPSCPASHSAWVWPSGNFHRVRPLALAIGSRSGEAVHSCHVTGAFCWIATLGITGTELDTLKARMMFTVTSLEAQVSALNAQIATLSARLPTSSSAEAFSFPGYLLSFSLVQKMPVRSAALTHLASPPALMPKPIMH
jgi:hypothetical protein